MAIICTVKKENVSKVFDGLWNVNVSLVVSDDGKEVLSRQFAVKYKPGYDLQTTVVAIKEAMQKAVDDYMAEQKLFADGKLDAAIVELNNQVTAKAV